MAGSATRRHVSFSGGRRVTRTESQNDPIRRSDATDAKPSTAGGLLWPAAIVSVGEARKEKARFRLQVR